MIFDNNVLNNICKYIDNPLTFYNFSIANSKLANISRLHKNNKMVEFSRKIVRDDFCNVDEFIRIVEYVLPNGNLHGIQYYGTQLINHDDKYELYYNGIKLAEWILTEEQDEFWYYIKYYNHTCFDNYGNGSIKEYTHSKIDLIDFNLYHSINGSSFNCDECCDKCGKHNYECEYWFKKRIYQEIDEKIEDEMYIF